MTSSTAPSERLRSLVTVFLVCVTAWSGAAVMLEAVSRTVESRFDAHLWRYEEWMQMLSPARYERRNGGRILVVGPSEAREAFWPAPFRAALGDVRLVNDSLSLSTLEDAITQLEYIDRVYGEGALGDLVIVAVTPRFLQGYAPGERPLPIALNLYSPYFGLDESTEPQRLVAKGVLESAIARARLAGHSGARYTKAIRAALVAATVEAAGGDLDTALRARHMVASRFFDAARKDKVEYYRLARDGGGYNAELRSMNLAHRRAQVLRDFDRIRALARRHRAGVLVVNLPEGGWARDCFYDPGVHEGYMTVLREAVGELPFMDLRDALPDDEFVDWVHPTMEGGLQISQKVAARIRGMEAL